MTSIDQTTTQLSEQIIELQTRLSFLEDTIDTLSDVIAQQDQALIDLQDQLKLIYTQMQPKDDVGIAPFDLMADRPPHY